MGDFKVIETQEQFDTAIGDRLKRERESTEKKFEGYLSPEDVEKKYSGYMSAEDVEKKYKGYLSPEDVAKKDAQIKKYETASVKARIAHETGIPFELVGRLNGETEDDIRKDAENLSKFIGIKGAPPLHSDELGGSGQKATEKASYEKLLSGLKGE